MVNNNNIEVVENLVYLDSQLSNKDGSEADMKKRIALAGVTSHRLWKKVFKKHEISLAIKLRLLNAAVMPFLLYGSETWSLTTVMENKLNACENRWLRRILRIKYTDRVSNAEVRVRTGQEIAENTDTEKENEMVWTYLQNEQGEVAIHSS